MYIQLPIDEPMTLGAEMPIHVFITMKFTACFETILIKQLCMDLKYTDMWVEGSDKCPPLIEALTPKLVIEQPSLLGAGLWCLKTGLVLLLA